MSEPKEEKVNEQNMCKISEEIMFEINVNANFETDNGDVIKHMSNCYFDEIKQHFKDSEENQLEMQRCFGVLAIQLKNKSVIYIAGKSGCEQFGNDPFSKIEKKFSTILASKTCTKDFLIFPNKVKINEEDYPTFNFDHFWEAYKYFKNKLDSDFVMQCIQDRLGHWLSPVSKVFVEYHKKRNQSEAHHATSSNTNETHITQPLDSASSHSTTGSRYRANLILPPNTRETISDVNFTSMVRQLEGDCILFRTNGANLAIWKQLETFSDKLSNLEHLDFTNTRLSDVVIDSLLVLLQRNTKLKELNLCNTKMDDGKMKKLFKDFTGNGTSKFLPVSLDLSKNKGITNSSIFILEQLLFNSNLLHVNLRKTGITCENDFYARCSSYFPERYFPKDKVPAQKLNNLGESIQNFFEIRGDVYKGSSKQLAMLRKVYHFQNRPIDEDELEFHHVNGFDHMDLILLTIYLNAAQGNEYTKSNFENLHLTAWDLMTNTIPNSIRAIKEYNKGNINEPLKSQLKRILKELNEIQGKISLLGNEHRQLYSNITLNSLFKNSEGSLFVEQSMKEICSLIGWTFQGDTMPSNLTRKNALNCLRENFQGLLIIKHLWTLYSNILESKISPEILFAFTQCAEDSVLMELWRKKSEISVDKIKKVIWFPTRLKPNKDGVVLVGLCGVCGLKSNEIENNGVDHSFFFLRLKLLFQQIHLHQQKSDGFLSSLNYSRAVFKRFIMILCLSAVVILSHFFWKPPVSQLPEILKLFSFAVNGKTP